jgi:hypothetical protein
VSADLTLNTDPPVVYPPVGRCIYCSSDGSDGLGDEHIIPYSLNGTRILPKASCHKCEGVTSYLEGFISRSVFWQLRTHAGMQSRSGLPTEFPVILHFEDGREEEIMVPADIHPALVVVPKFKMPSLLTGQMSDGNFRFTYPHWKRESAVFDELVKNKGAKTAGVKASIKPQQFSRFLAKIAHSYAVAQLRLEGFSPLLLDLIHQRNTQNAPELVGSEEDTPPPSTGVLHELSLVPNNEFVVVRIRLFASSSAGGVAMPVYLVVAGTRAAKSDASSG